MGGLVEAREVDVRGAAVSVAQLAARHAEVRAQLDERQHAPLVRTDALDRTGGELADRPRFVAEWSQPCGPEKSTSFRAASAGASRWVASWSSSSQPVSEIGAIERRR